MRRALLTPALVFLLALPAGCGTASGHRAHRAARAVHPALAVQRTAAQPRPPVRAVVAVRRATGRPRRPVLPSPPLQAVVTAPSENAVLVVGLPSGRVAARVSIPGDPEYAAASLGPGGTVVVPSSRTGTVTLLERTRMRPVGVLRGFGSPHIAAMSADGEYAYVTEDRTGQLAVIDLYRDRVTSRITVGAGAHHIAASPDGRRVWVALGQAARTIVTLSTVVSAPPPPSSPVIDAGHPHITGGLHLGFEAHDVLFDPTGSRVWVTSADTDEVSVFDARTHRPLFRVAAGPPPQHIAFDDGYAYITSGYGGQIEQVTADRGRVLRRAAAPYGSFEVDAAFGYVVTASLFRGTVAIYDGALRLLRARRVAPAIEDVVLSRR
jgi:DNA-binding beta-propeller fold protein YncE